MTRLVLASLLAALLAVGCSTAKAEAPATINTKCPGMGGDVDPEAGVSEWNGVKVGYCCAGCKPKFEALDDAGKRAALLKVGTKLD